MSGRLRSPELRPSNKQTNKQLRIANKLHSTNNKNTLVAVFGVQTAHTQRWPHGLIKKYAFHENAFDGVFGLYSREPVFCMSTVLVQTPLTLALIVSYQCMFLLLFALFDVYEYLRRIWCHYQFLHHHLALYHHQSVCRLWANQR